MWAYCGWKAKMERKRYVSTYGVQYMWSLAVGGSFSQRTRAAPSCSETLTTEPLCHPPCLMSAPSLKTDPVKNRK